jgi:hypothetical protein
VDYAKRGGVMADILRRNDFHNRNTPESDSRMFIYCVSGINESAVNLASG